MRLALHETARQPLLPKTKNRYPQSGQRSSLALLNSIYLVADPVGKLRFCPIERAVCVAASAGICPTSGFNTNGAGLLSGTGSTLMTAVPPDKSVGKERPAGALIKKSSPGNGGPPAALNGAALS